MTKIKIELELTDDQTDMLSDMMIEFRDAGSEHAGWQSPELRELSSYILSKIERSEEDN